MSNRALTVGRDVRNLWRRVNDPTIEPLERVRASAELSMRLRTLEHRLAERARNEGRTWAEIGQALEITRQGAQQRFG